MKQSHLNTWLGNFPNLRFILSKEDKAVLDTIDPAKYIDFNLTKETEVIRIINDHKPQAWKWVRLFPDLKNLSAEDYAILDHIVPNDFVGDVTEADLKRIIAYRKDNLRKAQAKEAEDLAKAYYRDHADEIAREEKDRTILSKIPQWATVFGTSFITAGVAMHGTAIDPMPYFVIGVPVIVLPWLICSSIIKKLDSESVIPRAIDLGDTRLGFLATAFIILFYAALIGLGIFLGTAFVWERLGWGSAEPIFWTGLLTIIGSAFLFVMLAIATPSKD